MQKNYFFQALNSDGSPSAAKKAQIPPDTKHQEHSIFCFTFDDLKIKHGFDIVWRVSSREIGHLFYIGPVEKTNSLCTLLRSFNKGVVIHEVNMHTKPGTAMTYIIECKFEMLVEIFGKPEIVYIEPDKTPKPNMLKEEKAINYLLEHYFPQLLQQMTAVIPQNKHVELLTLILNENARFEDDIEPFIIENCTADAQDCCVATKTFRQLRRGNSSYAKSVNGVNIELASDKLILTTYNFLTTAKNEMEQQRASKRQKLSADNLSDLTQSQEDVFISGLLK